MSLDIRVWFRDAGLVRRLLDSRFRGNDGGEGGNDGLNADDGKGICRSPFALDFVMPAWFAAFWIPAFAGMTAEKAGMTGLMRMMEKGFVARHSRLIS